MKKAIWIFLLIVALASGGLWTYSAVTQVSGLAIAQSATAWTSLRDLSVGDNIITGAGLFSPCLWNGAGCDRQRGSIANGALVDVSRIGGTAADNSANSSAKLPVLPCIAGSTESAWTATNQVPCTQTLNGYTRSTGPPVQAGTLFNSRAASVANTPITVTITAAAGQRAHLYTVKAACTPAGTSSMIVQDGATLIAGTNAAQVPTVPAEYLASWPTGLTGTINTNMLITVATCGVGNQGTLEVEADRF